MNVIKEYRMATDGIQAPGAIVIRQNKDNPDHPYVVHFRNDQVGGFSHGDYCKTFGDALDAFAVKCKRYDPTGDLHRAYLLSVTTGR